MTDIKQPSNRLQVVRSPETRQKISDSLRETYRKYPCDDAKKQKISAKMKHNWQIRKEEFFNNKESNERNEDHKNINNKNK